MYLLLTLYSGDSNIWDQLFQRFLRVSSKQLHQYKLHVKHKKTESLTRGQDSVSVHYVYDPFKLQSYIFKECDQVNKPQRSLERPLFSSRCLFLLPYSFRLMT